MQRRVEKEDVSGETRTYGNPNFAEEPELQVAFPKITQIIL